MLTNLKLTAVILIGLFTSLAVAKQQKLMASDGMAEDSFAYSVSIDGDTALIGAFKADVDLDEDAGAAYVYQLGTKGWQLEAKLVVRESRANDTLGGNVALNNNVAALGVIGRDDIAENAGAVLLFERESGLWLEQGWLRAFDATAGDAFGQSIALSENIMVVGAPRSDVAAVDSGSVYLYQRENGKWLFQGKLTASDGAQGDLFGISVAIDGNTVLVGADLNDQKSENAGAVYVFVLDGGQWQQEAKLVAADGGHTDIFGVRVALAGDTALISARRDDVEGIGIDAGSAYIFERFNGKWEQRVKLISPDGQADDRFGRGVAIKNSIAIISAMNHDASGKDAGAVYVYKKIKNNWVYTSKITAEDARAGDRLGWNVGLTQSPGKNKSRFQVIMASPSRSDKGVNSGAAYIHYISD